MVSTASSLGRETIRLSRGGREMLKEKRLSKARITAEETIAAGKIFGTLVFDMDHAKQMKDLGAQLLVHGADIVFYKKAYAEILGAYEGFC